MIVERSMHPDYRSNAYLLADEVGGTAVFIDAGAPIEPLMLAVDRLGVRVTHVLLTHDHHDHTTHAVELEERYAIPQVLAEQAVGGMTVPCGSLELRALSTPGHCSPHVAWLVERDGENCFTFFEAVEDDKGMLHPAAEWTSRGWNRDEESTCPTPPEAEI